MSKLRTVAGLAVAITVTASGFSAPAAAVELRIWNFFGWDAGSEVCLDANSGASCPDLITFSNPELDLAPLGPFGDRTASWRNGIDPDTGLSSLTVTGENGGGDGFSLAPGEEKLLSTFFHDNNVLSPFDEFFSWEMNMLANLFIAPNDGARAPTAADLAFSAPIAFNFVETLNALPCDVDPVAGPVTGPVDNPLDTVCDDRYIGTGAGALLAPIPVPGGVLTVRTETGGSIDFEQVGNDVVVHTAEPLDSTLQFFIRFDAQVVSEPAVVALVGLPLVLLGGVAGARRRQQPA